MSRLDDDDFVARVYESTDGSKDGLSTASRNGKLCVGVNALPIEAFDLVCDTLSKQWVASHRCILVFAIVHGFADQVDKLFGAHEVRKTLREVYSAVFVGKGLTWW
ncbi:hypothetical protein MASR1M65_19060 [Saprospiraceae bacterium]